MEKTPQVSIIIPVYNGAKFLEDTLTSARNQTLTNIEIVVIDDMSTDSSRDIINEHALLDQRLRPIYFKENSGAPAKPKNAGILAARGTYISFLDQDDIDHPEKLSWATNILSNHPNYDAVFFCSNSLSSEGVKLEDGITSAANLINEAAPFLTEVDDNLYSCTDWVRQMAGGRIGISTQGLVIRKDSLLKSFECFDEKFQVLDDTNAWFKLAYSAKLLFCSKPACWYRVRDDSVSRNLIKMRKEALTIHSFWHSQIKHMLTPHETARHRQFIADICTFLEWQTRITGAPSLTYGIEALKWGRSARHSAPLLKSLFSFARSHLIPPRMQNHESK